jgi:DNA-binding SARP family transcriptional activator/tetratricopeptide (TPR) repeat protein
VDSTHSLTLGLLGPFVLRADGCEITGLARKAQALVAFLAVQPDRKIPREIVADLLWTQSGPDQARHSLRQTLVALRKSRAADLVRANADALWIEAGAVEVDACVLEAALADADPRALTDSASRYRGALLEDLPAVSPGFDEWLRTERTKFTTIMARVLRRVATTQIAASKPDAAVETASRLVGLDTLDEAGHRLLIECLARAGKRAEALHQFETCAGILREELDIEPDAETVALMERIRAGACPPKAGEPPRRSDEPEDAANGTMRVISAVDDLPEPAVIARGSRWVRSGLIWAFAALCIVAGSAGVFALRPQPVRPPGIVFSGFRNTTGVPSESEPIAGFGDLVSDGLENRQHLRVIEDPTGDAKTTTEARDRVRRAAGGRYLLSGTVAFDQLRVHVSAGLTNVRDNTELWSSHYDISIDEIARTADEIATHAARAVAADREVVADAPRPSSLDAQRTATQLVSLGHRIDYFTTGAGQPSRQIYRVALRYDGSNADVLTHLAYTYLRPVMMAVPDQAALTEGEAILGRSIQIDPTNAYTLFNYCLLRREQGRVPEAIEACKRTLDIDPRYPGALRELGHDSLQSGDAAQAIDYYKASIDAAPLLRYVHINYKGIGVAELALGHDDDAVAYLRKSAQLDTMSVDNERVWLAAALEMDDRHDEATKVLADFTASHPGFRIDGEYLQLLRAPAYSDCRDRVLKALASSTVPVQVPVTKHRDDEREITSASSQS